MAGDTILIKDISINGENLTKTELSKTLTDNTINALGIDASSRTIWINGQPYGNAYVNINEDAVEAPIGGEIFNDFEHNIASGDYSHAEGSETSAAGDYSHAEGKGTITNNEAEHASGKYNQSNKDTTIFSVGIGTSDTDRKNAIEVTQDGDIYVNGIGGYNGTNPSNSKDIATYLPNMVYITYEALKTLRDSGQLVPGQQYRITDYTCTTSTPGTKSAGNAFDIIITADSNNKLNEEARAINHYFDNLEDDYFKDCNLSAWKIWYSIDNDNTRFDWTLGDKKYLGINYNGSTEYYEYVSTQEIDGTSYALWRISPISFFGSTSLDLNATCYLITYTGGSYKVQSQTTGTITDNTGAEGGKGVIYHMIDEFSNDCPYDFKNIQFYREQDKNTGLYSIILDDNTGVPCYTFSSEESSSTTSFTDMSLRTSNIIYFNVIKKYVHSRIQILNNNCFFGIQCYSNTLENNCSDNTFGSNCHFNTLGSNCLDNTFGDSCSSNTFGNYCSNNTFGGSCLNNIFGNSCSNNSFGSSCDNNTFGNDCDYNSFRVSASKTSTLKDYVCYNHFDDGCSYNVIWNSDTTSSTILLKNINANRGVVGTSSSYNMINIDVLNSEQEINVNQVDGIVSIGNILSIKYESLKALRDNAQLIPGQQYRIIDYTCTTVQENTRSAGHVFDIIVTADDETTLNEVARAINHHFDNLEDDHFKDCNLYAWKIWYCLDNDTNRFVWELKEDKYLGVRFHDTTERKVKYIETKDISGETYDIWNPGGNAYYGTKSRIIDADVYLINYDELTVAATVGTISDNTGAEGGKGVIYHMIDEFGNDCPYDFKNIQFYRQYDSSKSLWSIIPHDNTGVPCYTFSSEGSSSTTAFTDNSLSASNNVYSNVIKRCANDNKQTLNNNCFFGTNCLCNTFGNDCADNSFGKYCYNNIFDNYCFINSFGNYCYNNIFGNACYHNTFRNSCYNNIFGNDCYYNTFGNDCESNTLGNACQQIKFASDKHATTKYNYYRYNHFGDGCQHILFKGAATASPSAQVQNYNFSQGINCGNTSYKYIDAERGLSYETRVLEPGATTAEIKSNNI